MYTAGCRCDDCKQAKAEYSREYERRKVLERWGMAEPTLIDSTPSRQHLDYLMASGMGHKQIAKVSGVALTVIQRLVGIATSRPAHRVTRATEAKILAVQPTLDNLAPKRLVPAGPTARRVQALVALGYPMKHLAERLGILQQNFLLHNYDDSHTVTAATARSVAALYDELSMTTPPQGRARTLALNYAAKHGWPPPLAWDDIDAGDLDPTWNATARVRGIDADDCAVCADIEHLAFFGETFAVIHNRLGMSDDGLTRHLQRHRPDLLRRLQEAS